MLKDFKKNRSREDPLAARLGTPDGLLALGEFIRNIAVAFSLLLLTGFILFNKEPVAQTMLRVIAALALNKALRIGNRGWHR